MVSRYNAVYHHSCKCYKGQQYVQELGRRRVIITAPARQIAIIPGRVEYLWHAVKGALNQSCTLIISRSTVTV